MGIMRTAVLMSGLTIGIAMVPVKAVRAEQAAPIDAQVEPAATANQPLLGILRSVPADNGLKEEKNPCAAPHLYSQHDVVGDPEACFMGQATFGSGATATSGASLGR
jgi:hypothetical protein